MQIIPVIDLLNGIVVHAKKGERHRYQAITSALTPSSEPLAIVAALLALHPFQQLYIADLNAIQKLGNTQDCTQSNNFDVIASIAQHYPNLTLWVDAGISNLTELDLWSQLNLSSQPDLSSQAGVKLILGSENFVSMEQYLAIYHVISEQTILSLDFMPTGYQGPQALLESTAYWPQAVIIMSLAHVGANQGVNLQLLTQTQAKAGDFNLYAAGGVRDIADLNTLKSLGIHGALIATAIHSKQLTQQQLTLLQQQ
ncbi:HisA/HisF-related TIM barrel protein [Methylotenera mobilis]|uniref:Histidine biosynthesis protein n=1 Tax=Methylotenera mobilis (strain JLW8 / ATCC BAA-1282 / DSM 17540) TaxID=583345 RepID=C6WWE3_METML|nr:HisA/HisF-related TIM barrel protein [Methylotenera mobilis]ACT48242.1 histidine biosynthesis protein [Methylotenera mobilis JLW8]